MASECSPGLTPVQGFFTRSYYLHSLLLPFFRISQHERVCLSRRLSWPAPTGIDVTRDASPGSFCQDALSLRAASSVRRRGDLTALSCNHAYTAAMMKRDPACAARMFRSSLRMASSTRPIRHHRFGLAEGEATTLSR